ncbi:hypothetical protein [Rhodococcus sp. 2G]|uniref:hypothetical protein n=1 Tax=Rhodococcus sp. 2G TaxID=1570939 RepID=UPI000AB89D19|nr:hypothetical protein [Rhodococcus sp. 2G]
MSKMPPTVVNIIVAAAGKGTRFGARYAKELHLLPTGHAVVDRVLEPWLNAISGEEFSPRVIIVGDESRGATLAHVAERYPKVPIGMCLQRADAPNVNVNVLSAARQWIDSGVVIYLLADQILTAADAVLVGALKNVQDGGIGVLVAGIPASARPAEGCIELDTANEHVVTHMEKPPAEDERYNHAWAALVANANQLDRLIDGFQNQHDEPWRESKAIHVQDYVNINSIDDLSTVQ